MSEACSKLDENIVGEIESRGIEPEKIVSQIEMFERGVAPAELVRPCTLGDGIVSIEGEAERYALIFDEASADKEIVKFVPASGAASRMFKELLSVLNRWESADRKTLEDAALEGDKEAENVLRFVDNIGKFAFLEDLRASLKKAGHDPDTLLSEGCFAPEVLEHVLLDTGLNYSNLPKGIIRFHRYPDRARTAFEEHLEEAFNYAVGKGGRARVHFTVSPEHLEKVKGHIWEVMSLYEGNQTTLEIDFSVQKPSTDTIAVDMDNRPFLDADGKPVFRPGGHGALIVNLNELNCDVAFIKNIDNVVPDRFKDETYLYKKALGGYLIELERRAFSVLRMLDEDAVEGEVLRELEMVEEMGIDVREYGGFENAGWEKKKGIIRHRLMRPIRVCGVVRNVSEPGGGPFFVSERDGSVTKQIVESAQVDMDSSDQKAIWGSSTHFNPVDIVCGLRDYKGNPYDLTKYVDPEAAFISIKSKDGRELKALELPGLWNGAMARWNSVFIEVPLITFNPVKTVFDLLRPEHQPE